MYNRFRTRGTRNRILSAAAPAIEGWLPPAVARALIFTGRRGYSFAPFYRTRSVFVHVPKTAGIAVAEALFGSRCAGHRSVRDYLKLMPQDYHRFFSFTFVRHPCDRLVSAYSFLREGGMSSQDRAFAERAGLTDGCDFATFVLERLDDRLMYSAVHLVPQVEFLVDETQALAVDFIGRFEALERDVAHVARRLGVHCALPRRNASRRDASDGLEDARVRARVRELYAADFERLGYE